MMVRRVGLEPTTFTLRDQFYRLARDHHPRSRRVVAGAGLEPATSRI